MMAGTNRTGLMAGGCVPLLLVPGGNWSMEWQEEDPWENITVTDYLHDGRHQYDYTRIRQVWHIWWLSGFNFKQAVSIEASCINHCTYSHNKLLQVAYGTVMPLILALGIVGNFINIIVFCQRMRMPRLDVMEKSATAGLISLAIADFMFCVIGFPSAFVESRWVI